MVFRLNGTEISPESQYNFPVKNNYERYSMNTPWSIHSTVCLQILSSYAGYSPSLLTNMVYLKVKDNLGLSEMNKNISNTNNVSEWLGNRIKLFPILFSGG